MAAVDLEALYERLNRGFCEWHRARERLARIDALTSTHTINPWKGPVHGDQ